MSRSVVVRYEDLRVETARELGRILDFVGTPGDAKAVQDAVDFAAFERMRARESSTEIVGAGGRLTADTNNPDSFKTRRAKVGGYDDVSEAEAAEIDAYLAEHLDPMYGYNPSETRSRLQ